MSTAALLADMYMKELPKDLQFKFGGWGSKGKKTAIIVSVTLLVAAAGAGIGYVYWKKKQNETKA